MKKKTRGRGKHIWVGNGKRANDLRLRGWTETKQQLGEPRVQNQAAQSKRLRRPEETCRVPWSIKSEILSPVFLLPYLAQVDWRLREK